MGFSDQDQHVGPLLLLCNMVATVNGIFQEENSEQFILVYEHLCGYVCSQKPLVIK